MLGDAWSLEKTVCEGARCSLMTRQGSVGTKKSIIYGDGAEHETDQREKTRDRCWPELLQASRGSVPDQ